MAKTRHFRTSAWPFGNADHHLSTVPDIYRENNQQWILLLAAALVQRDQDAELAFISKSSHDVGVNRDLFYSFILLCSCQLEERRSGKECVRRSEHKHLTLREFWCAAGLISLILSRVACSKLLHAFKLSVALSQPVGERPVSHLKLAEHFPPFFPSVSTGLPTHSSYLSVPAETRPHLAFSIHPHSSLPVWLLFDELELTGRNLTAKVTKRLSVPFHEVSFALFISYRRRMFVHLKKAFFPLNASFAETAHSICGNWFHGRADLVPRLLGGKGAEGEKWLLVLMSGIKTAVNASLHTMMQLLLYSDVKNEVHAYRKHTHIQYVQHVKNVGSCREAPPVTFSEFIIITI